jgi:hypothetical protein
MTTPSQTPVVVSRIQNRRGIQSQFYALYPPGYTGVGGFDSGSYNPPFNIENYPTVLMPGELALCTDSRNLYMGNINGEYIRLGTIGSGVSLNTLVPVLITLPVASTFTVIPQLSYLATPFATLLYSVTDSISGDWNTVGDNFSKNGQLQITAIASSSANPVTLTDTGTEINAGSYALSFIAQYSAGNIIDILYKHNFPSSLTFSSTDIKWIPF